MEDVHYRSMPLMRSRTTPSPPGPLTRGRANNIARISDGDNRSFEDPLETVQVSQEAPWDKQGEDLLRSWLATAKQQASAHRKRGFQLKRLYKFFGILSIITAAVVFLFSNITVSPVEREDTITKMVFAFINLIVANLVSFLDYGPKYRHQFEFEGLFTKVSIDLTEILSIHVDYRAPKDRTLAEYKEKIGSLFTYAPET